MSLSSKFLSIPHPVVFDLPLLFPRKYDPCNGSYAPFMSCGPYDEKTKAPPGTDYPAYWTENPPSTT